MLSDGVIAGEAEIFLLLYKTGGREFGSILSGTRTQTEFLDSPKLRDILQRSDFRLADLKRQKATVYLCLPAGRMASHANWLRVMIALSLQAFEREPGKPDIPILLMMDEFPVLGYMRSIEAAAGQIAGFGVKLWTVMQDLGQIKKLYQSSWETFVGNAGVLTFFGNTDLTTLRYVSAKLGRIGMNLERASRASGPDLTRGVNPIQEDLRESALLEPHEVELTLARETGRVLVLAAGRKPVILQRARYYADRPFGGLFDNSKETASMARSVPPRESRRLRGLCGEVRFKREEQVARTWHTKGPLRIGVDRESRHPLKVEFDEYSWPEKRTQGSTMTRMACRSSAGATRIPGSRERCLCS